MISIRLSGRANLTSAPVARLLKSEAGAVVLWVLATILLAATLAPGLYGWGKEFGAAHSDSDGLAGWLAGSCERARFGRYFNRSMLIAGLVLLWPLLLRVRILSRARGTRPANTWSGIGWQTGVTHGLAGFAAAAGLLWLLGIAVESGGAFIPSENHPSTREFLSGALIPALGASIIEEWIFRAVLIGLWLRIGSPLSACVGTSLVFAFVHFLDPPHGAEIPDPHAWSAGFGLLGMILRNYFEPQFIAAEFLTLFVVGLSLAWARLRTGSLWLPVGMHAGWIFSFKGFNMFHQPAPSNGMAPLLVGDTLRAGLLPLATLAITWLLLFWLLPRLPHGRSGPVRP